MQRPGPSPGLCNYVVLCCAVFCHAVLCCAMSCCVVSHCAVLHCCCVVLCCVMLCHVVSYCAVLCCIVLYCVLVCCAMLCCVTLCCIVLCCVVFFCRNRHENKVQINICTNSATTLSPLAVLNGQSDPDSPNLKKTEKGLQQDGLGGLNRGLMCVPSILAVAGGGPQP